MLWGPVNHIKHLFSTDKLTFTLSYFLSLFITLYAALIVSIIAISVQCVYVRRFERNPIINVKFR